MARQNFNMSPERIERLFPFFFLFNERMEITDAGSSLLKIRPQILNNSFFGQFSIIRPHREISGFGELSKLTEQVVILRTNDESPLLFRGQFLYLEEEHSVFFAGSPWVTDIDELKQHNLYIRDFAIHNTITDMLQVLKSKQIVMDDIKMLVNKIEEEKSNLNIVRYRLQTLIRNLRSGILLESEDRKIALVNEEFIRIFGIPARPEELLGLDCKASAEQSKSLFTNEEEFVSRIEYILSNKQTVQNDLLHTKDGRIFERDFVPIRDGENYLGHLWEYRDITRQIQTDAIIRMNEEKYRRVMENLDLGILEVDNSNIVIKAYPGYCKLTGYEENELIGTSALLLLAEPDDIMMLRRQTKNRLSGETGVYEVRLRKKNGDIIWVTISGAPVYDLKGEVTGSIGIHWDITEVKKREEELRKAKEIAESSSDAKRRFMAQMSHELRTPIHVIRGIVNQLAESPLASAQLQDLQAVQLSATNLLNIVNDLLHISQIEAGKAEVRQENIFLAGLIRDTLQPFMLMTRKKGLDMQMHLPENLPELVSGDEMKLKQIINNLVGNAIKFTEKGSISIQAEWQKETNEKGLLRLVFRDTGIGIPKEKQEVIFEPFKQAEENTNRRFGGTGLGLSITRELAQLMGGSVSVYSDEGQGSEFTVIIPLHTPASLRKEKESRKNERLPDMTGKKILLAEDSILNQKLALRMLEPANCKVTCVENGLEAVSLMQREDFDLVLMDIQMPQMDGYAASREIRSNPGVSNRLVPIIALTAHAVEGEMDIARDAGMNDFLPKPFDKEELWSILCKYLEEKKETRAPFDLAYLEQLADGDQDFTREIIRLFMSKGGEMLRQLKSAVKENNREAAFRALHTFKSSGDTIGAARLSAICLAGENNCKSWKQQQMESTCTELETEFDYICKRLSHQLNETA